MLLPMSGRGQAIEVLAGWGATQAERRLLPVRCSPEIRGTPPRRPVAPPSHRHRRKDPIAANVQAGGAGDVFRSGGCCSPHDIGPRGHDLPGTSNTSTLITTRRWRVPRHSDS